MLKDVSRSSSVANMSTVEMEEMIVKLRKENKKLKEENEELKEQLGGTEDCSWDYYTELLKLREENTNLNTLKEENEELEEDKLDLSQKIDILTKELEQCITIISQHHEERKQNKKK